ncbi:MAG: HD domain-containing protein [Eubacteriaceae bacterium]|nr:HD domain-containing protein [Eubacteriaceae bacterium]
MAIDYETLRDDAKVKAYINAGNNNLRALGYTDHSFAHVCKSAETASFILAQLGYPKKSVELAKIAGLLHDIGNMINRTFHALTGAEIARDILESKGMAYKDIALVCSAIGNHDEDTGSPVNEICAALIVADKSDVRRSRVQEQDMDKILLDIHDRVNYAVEKSEIDVVQTNAKPVIKLKLDIDSSITSVMDYFEIFLSRMLMCRRAAHYLGSEFELVINNLKMM